MRRVCEIEGCTYQGGGRLTRGMCQPHYKRWHRTGTAGPAQIGPQRRAVVSHDGCSILGCGRPHLARGYCEMHYDRWRTHGDPQRVNTNWGGDGVGYVGAHARVRRQRGAASNYSCVECQQPAAQWAYDHTDPAPRVDDRGSPYSLNVERYRPMCSSCHQLFDFAQRGAAV